MQIKNKSRPITARCSLEISICGTIEHTQQFLNKIQSKIIANGLLNFGLTIHKRLKSCYFSHTQINVPYMKTTKKIGLFFKIFLVVMCLIVGGFLYLEMLFYNKHLTKYQMKWRWTTTVHFTEKRFFDGLSGLNLSEITLVPKNADTLFKIKNKNKRQLVAAT
jgi:hypothetical protein